ncbi:hypothetical protein CaCOL14_003038 [Colletotrichum acutatum]
MDAATSTLLSHNVLVRPNDAQADADDAAVACAENISLLFLLNKLQHMSEPNRPVPQPAEEEERMLPFCRERSLCGALAFLASIDGNPDFIPAVYIEELTKSQQLEVVVAVNKESPRDDFENRGSEIEDSVFREVVAMCYTRILKRMRINIPEESGIEEVIVNLASSEPGAYERVSEGSRYPELNKALSRNEIKALPDRKLRSIWKNAHSPSKDVKHVFENKTSNTLKSAKVHAEVQLIYHYHLKSRHSDLPPRVIRSSKDACYLCNAFIKAEKTFYTSRCHGRLYPSWKLPRVVSRLDLAQRFNELLKGRIISAYGDLAGFRANCPKADPAESTISTLNWSVSTEAEEPSVTTVPGAINVVIVTTEKETENQEVPQDLEAQNDFVENKNMIQEEPQEGNQNGQQESTSGLIVSDAEEIPNKGSQPDEPVESRIHIEQKEEERETLQGQAAEDSIATTVVGQDDEARTTEASPGRRNAAPVQEDRTPRISPAIRISHGTRIQSQSPDRRSKPRRKQRPIRIRTSYAVIRKTYCPEGVSIKNTVYSIEETAVYSNDGEIETKKRTFPLAREGNKVLQERMLPARIRIMMNILANV